METKVFVAKAPSNIAFLKYWGKMESSTQWPSNNSLSMTLKNCHTETKAYILKGSNQFEVFYEGKEVDDRSFREKIIRFLSLLKGRFSYEHFLRVDTKNSFPTASGVASSASGFAALTLAALCAWTNSNSMDELEAKGFSKETLADLSRLGSGSSCRSFHEGIVLWEKGSSSDSQKVSSLFSTEHLKLTDTVVVLAPEKKELSSSEAHLRVWTSPLFQTRLAALVERQQQFLDFIKKKDFKSFGLLLEQEALDIHAVLMTADRPHSYLKDETQDFLVWLRNLRQEKRLEAYFTIDAGANVHVITRKTKQKDFIKYLKRDYPDTKYIEDSIGSGPELSQETLETAQPILRRGSHDKRPNA